MDFGFTNDVARLRSAEAFRDAAVADGWSIKATYGGSEPVERAATLTRDGFHMSILTRDNEVSIHIWGPDRLAVAPPATYDFAEIKARVRRCLYCKADDVETERVGFAGRCCAVCLPKMRADIERPGWTN